MKSASLIFWVCLSLVLCLMPSRVFRGQMPEGRSQRSSRSGGISDSLREVGSQTSAQERAIQGGNGSYVVLRTMQDMSDIRFTEKLSRDMQFTPWSWRSASWKELLAHAVLMGGVAFSLVRRNSQGVSAEGQTNELMNSRPNELSSANSEEVRGRGPQLQTANHKLQALLIALAITAGFAFLIEVLQTALPASFSRGFSWDDFVASLVGGVAGCAISFVVDWNRSKKTTG